MGRYDDIIDLPHHVSTTRPRMSMQQRAAQFSPFAALTGYEEALDEERRETVRRPEISEYVMDEIDRLLPEAVGQDVRIRWYRKDERKEGGHILDTTGILERIDTIRHQVIMADGTWIPLADVLELVIR